MNKSLDLYPIYCGDSDNYYRMPDEVCSLNALPVVDYRNENISNRNTYLNICKYYDQFKIKYDDYKSSNWVPSKKEYILKFGVHYQCYKQDRATFECLLNFRIHYPEIPIVLVSDNGHDFSQMSKYFNCTYIHEKENSGNGITNVLLGNNKINIWLNRIKRTCNILSDVDYILYMEDDLLTRDRITKNPNADLAGPSNPDDFTWSPQILNWLKINKPNVEVNGLNGCGGSIFSRSAFLECLDNVPDYQSLGRLDDRLTWASDVIITFLFMYNNKISRRWLDHSEECRGKIFGSTAFDHQYKYFYDKKWSEYYLKNTELDKNNNFIFTACSDPIFEDQMIPFLASLKENTNFNGTLLVIDYGLSDTNLIYLTNNNVRVIPGIGKYEIVSDRFVSISRYINFLNDPFKVFSHYDCDIWFNKDISHIFDMCRNNNTTLCTKDVWHCGFLHDCVRNDDHKEYNRNILFEVENRCGKVLQAGFICGNMKFWRIFSQYIDKLINNGYLKNSFGTDELALNLMYYYMESQFTILSIGYNTLPQWGIKDVNDVLVATDFHTDSKLTNISNHIEEVFAIHLSSAARNRKEFEYIDYKIRHREKYLMYLNSYKTIPNIISKDKIIINYGYRNTLPRLLNETDSKIICEIGVQTGGNLFHMVSSPSVSEAYGIDIWKNTDKKSQNDIGLSDDQMEDMYNRVTKMSEGTGKIKIIRDFSLIAAKQFRDEYFDFVYIDADHSYEGCRDDILCWWSKVKHGGILAGDDYVEAISSENVKFGVIDAVNEFVNINKLHDCFFNTWGKDNKGSSPQWFIIKL